jgi:hypothetical protein
VSPHLCTSLRALLRSVTPGVRGPRENTALFVVLAVAGFLSAFPACEDRLCTLIGCDHSLAVHLTGAVPDSFTVTVEAEEPTIIFGPRARIVRCSPEDGCFVDGGQTTVHVDLGDKYV